MFLGQEIVAPPPPPDVAQSHLLERLGLLLPKQMTPCEDTITTNSSIGGSSGFSSYANGDHTSDVGSLSPSPAHGNTLIWHVKEHPTIYYFRVFKQPRSLIV